MEAYTKYNLLAILLASAGSVFGGYGLAVIGSTLGQPTFYQSLSLEADPTALGYSYTSKILGASNGVFFAGGFIGTFISGWAGDKLGRVNGFRVASVIGIIGGALQSGAINVPMYLVARVVTGMASGHTFSAMPIYYAEISPPHSRGMMTGAHGWLIALGYSLAGWIGLGCYFAPDTTFSWRFPNAVLAILALILLAGTFFIPESPRWLVSRNRCEQALKILSRLHHDRHDADDQFAHRELALIQRQYQTDAANMARDGKWALFTVKTYRKRLILACMIMAAGQDVGALVINNYSVLLYARLGLSNTMALVLGALFVTVGMCAGFGTAYISDKIGRRWAIVGGLASTTSVFVVVTGLIGKYYSDPSDGVAKAAIFFIFLYIVAYAVFDGSQFTAATEIFPSHLRSQAASCAISVIFLMDILWLELAPTAQISIGWKYYLVFVALGIFHTVFLYFYLPDTSGMALEEIDVVFGKQSAGHLSDENLEVQVGSLLDLKGAVTEKESYSDP